eukprot:symbB.v1.2.002892.t1/scaffold156.1/size293155/4
MLDLNDLNFPNGSWNFSVPILVQARSVGADGILMPWWAYLQQDWTRRYTEKLVLASWNMPWHSKVPKLFWRGSDTHCLHPGSCQDATVRCACGNFTSRWIDFPRSRLVLWSKLMPQKVDAKFTKDVIHRELRPTFVSNELLVEEIVPPETHLEYKYLMYLDGVSFSDRLFWLFLTESVVFKGTSSLRVWMDASLMAWEHYVPVAEDLSDLPERLHWAEKQDEQGRLHDMALRAAHHASIHLSLEGSLLYLYHLLQRLSQVLPTSVSSPEPPVPSPVHRSERQRQTQMNARKYLAHALEMLNTKHEAKPEARLPPYTESVEKAPECWTMGFTAEFCCDLLISPEGNPACWDEDYTFAYCC